MRIRTFAAAAAVVAAGLLTTAAVNAADTGAQEKEIAARIFSTTGMKVDKVTPAPIEGLWEVFMNRRVFYVDKSAKYLIVGRIFDTKTETTSKGVWDSGAGAFRKRRDQSHLR